MSKGSKRRERGTVASGCAGNKSNPLVCGSVLAFSKAEKNPSKNGPKILKKTYIATTSDLAPLTVSKVVSN